MSLSPGQLLALEQLEEIEQADSAGLELLEYRPPHESDDQTAVAIVSIPCGDMPKTADGLRLRAREKVRLHVPRDFPYRPPAAWTDHTRFAGFPHVQWSSFLCLYVSVATEWDASDGMFGFIDRLEEWFRLAAQDQLDPLGAPLHPPVAYKKVNKLIIPRADTPAVGETAWIGLAHLRIVSEHRVDIVDWSGVLDSAVPPDLAAAILLSEELPFEYPTKACDLLDLLERQGVSRGDVHLALAVAARRNIKDAPLYVVVGAPMRGIRGESKPKQHLTAWFIESELAAGLRLSLEKYRDDADISAIAQRIETLVSEWLELVEVAWVTVREDRPEVTIRRDKSSPMEWFQGKKVALWGCGALGGPIAEQVARAGVRTLVLRDVGVVAPGLLSRQPYEDRDIGYAKARVLAKRLERVRPHDLEICFHTTDLLDVPLEDDDWTDGADLIIDATAARPVVDKLEWRRRYARQRAPMIAVAVDKRAERGLVVLAGRGHTGGPADVLRRAKVELGGRPETGHFADEFWPPDEKTTIFQPEPGCSAPTFIGSATDASSLASSLLNMAVVELGKTSPPPACALVLTQSHVHLEFGSKRQARFEWVPDIVTHDPHSNYEVRISRAAWNELLGWIRQSHRTNGFSTETGGVLFGERDDASRVIWVTEVTGPPPDSEASEDFFLCGVEGVDEANSEKRKRSRGSICFVGMWHTHPNGEPIPSLRDMQGMCNLVNSESPSTPRPLLIIIGTNLTDEQPSLGSFVFHASDFDSGNDETRFFSSGLAQVRRVKDLPSAGQPDVGLALSGGGSRAIAFHLGCLRALNDRGLLERVHVISGVSGGSVIAGMYAYGEGDFSSFDRSVVAFLEDGLIDTITKKLCSWRMWLKWPEAAVAGALAALASLVKRNPPFVRRFSRTSAFETALATRIFGNRRLTDATRGNVNVVFNSCELRTGTAFRFGNRESGNWRLGKLVNNSIPVAHAVAASAAYPALLPSIDEKATVVKDGHRYEERVVLTDGGIYDNLGVTCMEPERSPDFGFNTYRPSYIICCDAGHGQFDGSEIPFWWPSRMKRSFESVFRKAQDSTRHRLHSYGAQASFRGFILSYLGQQDDRLPHTPPDLVRRQEVSGYPTDFSPMPSDMIRLLSLRGEQLTRLLLARWCPNI